MRHIKTDIEDYYIDDQDNIQDEFKSYHMNGQLLRHCFYVDGKIHGEYNSYWSNGRPQYHCHYVDGEYHGEYILYHSDGRLMNRVFYANSIQVTDEVNTLVSDISNITSEEKVMLKLKFGFDV